MKLPKGFGKNYFTLRAITATSNQVTLNKNRARVQDFHIYTSINDDFEEDPPEEEILLNLPRLSNKPCHCNCYYLKRTKKILLLCSTQKFDTLYFKTLNNSISPPYQKPAMDYTKQL